MVFGYRNLDRSRKFAIHEKWTTALLCFKTCVHLLLIDFLSIWRNSQICSQLTLVRVISTWETNVPRCILPGTLNVKVTDINFWNTPFLQFLFSFFFCIILSALNNVKTTLSSFAITLGKCPKELKVHVRVRIPAAVNHFTSNQQFSEVTSWQMELNLASQWERHVFFYSRLSKVETELIASMKVLCVIGRGALSSSFALINLAFMSLLFNFLDHDFVRNVLFVRRNKISLLFIFFKLRCFMRLPYHW